MGRFRGAGFNHLVEHGNNRSAIVAADFLHFRVHLSALVLIQLGSCHDQQLVEPFIAPEGIIPGSPICIGNREHHVFNRTSALVAHDPFFLDPDVAPVAVIRLAHNIDVDAGFFGLFFN